QRRIELLGQNIRQLVPAWNFEPADFNVDDLDSVMLKPPVADREFLATRADGSIFPAEISVSPVQSEEGLLITSSIRDISERKKAELARRAAEEQIRELNAHLEERVLERTEDLLRS